MLRQGCIFVGKRGFNQKGKIKVSSNGQWKYPNPKKIKRFTRTIKAKISIAYYMIIQGYSLDMIAKRLQYKNRNLVTRILKVNWNKARIRSINVKEDIWASVILLLEEQRDWSEITSNILYFYGAIVGPRMLKNIYYNYVIFSRARSNPYSSSLLEPSLPFSSKSVLKK